MIKIKRGSAPDYLVSDRVNNAKKLLEKKYSDESRQERLRFDISILGPIKEDLLKLCNGKCAYCESSIGVWSLGDIENFRPKGGARGFDSNEYAPMHYWWLTYEWKNLLISCQICNKYKRDFFPLKNESLRSRIGSSGTELLLEEPLLIDPSFDNPDEHLEFYENGIVKELTKRGKVTIELLGLNRSELVKRRKRKAKQFADKLKILLSTPDFSSRYSSDLLAYVNELFSENPSQEYVALERAVFDNWFEKNSDFWEKTKNIQNDISLTIRPQKFYKSGLLGSDAEISEVKTKLSSIKRFSIKKIKIENFKSIEKLTLNIKSLKDNDNRESWLLLLGDNGIGKSSILQAIALCLSTQKQLDKLKLNVNDYLRSGAENGRIEIQSYEHDVPVVLLFDSNGFISQLQEAPTFILGYGSTRLLPKGNIKEDNEKEPYFNIRNLFDYSIALNNPNAWLSKLDVEEFKSRVAPAFFDILALRGDDRLFIENGTIKIQQFGRNHDLEYNSDGYKTITALVSDIMQTLSVEKANYHNSQGIVLIDEIGNHLHPRWRMKIVGALRKAFPNLQFIVTSHEPLCLRGLSHGEVAVLVRDKRARIKAICSDLLPDHNLMKIEQLLTSDLFGLMNTLDEETEKTYEEYYSLLSKKDEEKSSEDLVKIQKLSSVISEKEMLGSTPREQIMFKLIDETYAKKMRIEGFKTTEELKNETFIEIKSILDNKNLDWL